MRIITVNIPEADFVRDHENMVIISDDYFAASEIIPHKQSEYHTFINLDSPSKYDEEILQALNEKWDVNIH